MKTLTLPTNQRARRGNQQTTRGYLPKRGECKRKKIWANSENLLLGMCFETKEGEIVSRLIPYVERCRLLSFYPGGADRDSSVRDGIEPARECGNFHEEDLTLWYSTDSYILETGHNFSSLSTHAELEVYPFFIARHVAPALALEFCWFFGLDMWRPWWDIWFQLSGWLTSIEGWNMWHKILPFSGNQFLSFSVRFETSISLSLNVWLVSLRALLESRSGGLQILWLNLSRYTSILDGDCEFSTGWTKTKLN